LRGVSRHWKPESNVVWIRPEAYAARKRRFSVRRLPGTMGLGPWLAAAIAAGLYIGTAGVPVPHMQRASAPVRASFSYCKWGGGTNCVVDGDTFWIQGEKVRIADIDAPETHPPRCAEEADLGERATLRLQALLNGGPVTLAPADRDTDRYGRLLRIVERNGQSLGGQLVSEGLARRWTGRRMPWCDGA
jgi:micrococcal nuclease